MICRAQHLFLRRQPQIFFFGFQEHGRQGYLDDFCGKKLEASEELEACLKSAASFTLF
jgi:hypothetical protein